MNERETTIVFLLLVAAFCTYAWWENHDHPLDPMEYSYGQN